MKKNSVLVALVLFVLFSPTGFSYGRELRLGIIPRRPAPVTMKMFKPLADKMSEATGETVSIVFSKNFQTFLDDLRRGSFDVAHIGTSDYLVAREAGYRLLAKNEEFGKSTIASVIYVRKDSNINRLTDLRGKRIIFGGGENSLIPLIAPTYILMKNGLKPEDYQGQIAQNPYNAVYAVYKGAGDAGCAADITLMLPNVKEKIDTDELKSLVQLGPFPHLPWVASERLGEELIEKIRTFLLALDDTSEGRAVLASAQITGLRPTTDEEYEEVGIIMKEYHAMRSMVETTLAAAPAPEEMDSGIIAPGGDARVDSAVKEERIAAAPPQPPIISAEAAPPPAPRETPPEPAMDATATKEGVLRFVEDWRMAWSNRDIDRYISCYVDDFTMPGKNTRQWITYKKGLFNKYRVIQVGLRDIAVKLLEREAQVTFKQEFQGDSNKDFGLKTLRLFLKDGKWRIVEETWKPL